MAVGRAVDLTRLDGYADLHRKLEEMFDIQGELSANLKKWKVIYTDDEDDTMLVGDDPWKYGGSLCAWFVCDGTFEAVNFVADLTLDFLFLSFFRCSEFLRMVKRIYIYSYEEAKSLTRKAKPPVVGDTIKPDPNKLPPESDVPHDSNNNAPVAADYQDWWMLTWLLPFLSPLGCRSWEAMHAPWDL
jgi:auxin response factor